MQYNFDVVRSRKGMTAGKWEVLEVSKWKDHDFVPFSVADMDLVTPQPLIDAVVERASLGMYGYTPATGEYFDAIANWMDRRHGWKVDPEWITPLCGVVNGIYEAVKAFTEPGDKIIIQPPVYFPFKAAVLDSKRTLVENPLKIEDGRYVMDFEDLEAKAANAKMIIVCNPHNPVGRVWTREELTRLGEICLKHGVKVVIDEIHGDLINPDYELCAFGTLAPELADNAIVCTSASKSFSIPGLNTASIIISNEELRNGFRGMAYGTDGLHFQNTFGTTATIAAYNKCEDWMDQVCAYLKGNFEAFRDFMAEHFPSIKVYQLEGTYLVWFDCNSLGLEPKELEKFMVDECGIYLDEGYMFGPAGEGFERMNLACPRHYIIEALERMYAKAVEKGLPL